MGPIEQGKMAGGESEAWREERSNHTELQLQLELT